MRTAYSRRNPILAWSTLINSAMCFAVRARSGRMLGMCHPVTICRGRVLAREELPQLGIYALQKLGQVVPLSSRGLFGFYCNLLKARG